MNRTKLLPLIGILCAISLLAMILTLNGTEAEPVFTPPPFEENARTGTPAATAEMGYQELDVTWFRVGLCGELRVNDGMVDVWFSNPEGNKVWLKLRILDENGNILGQSGILRPGEYLRSIQLTEIPAPGCIVIMKVMAYEPETYHSAGTVELHTVISTE